MSGVWNPAFLGAPRLRDANALIRQLLVGAKSPRDASGVKSCCYGGPKGKLARDSVGQSSTRSLASAEFLYGGFEVGDVEIGPAFRQENEFGEGALPQ
jgi:hypothetical protein